MTVTTLFGIALAPLYSAIAAVESDRGATSENVYQIRRLYVRDCNRIVGTSAPAFSYDDVRDPRRSEEMMLAYWRYWGAQYEAKTGKKVTCEVLARIHNGGPDGWKKQATRAYWSRVSRILKTQTPADVDAWTGVARARGKR